MPGGSDLRISFDLSVYFLRHLHGVAVGLTVDVEQHRRLAVGRHDRVTRFHPGFDRRDVSDAHRNARGSVLDHDVRDLLRGAHLSADQPKHQLVIAIEQVQANRSGWSAASYPECR